MMKKILLFLSISILVLSNLKAATVEQADSAYLNGNYNEAAALYAEIADTEGISAPLLFNMGNAYLKAGDYGLAMLAYQRAKKLAPSDRRINSNINYLREKVEDANKAEQKGKRKKVTEDTPNFFQSIHTAIAENNSSDSWAGWAAAFFLIFIGCGALYLFTTNVLTRKTGFFGGFIFLGLSIIFLVCAFSSASAFSQKEYGVIVSYKTELQTEPASPSKDNQNEGVLTRGTKVRVIAEETYAEGKVSWFKVRLNSDYLGWVSAEALEII